MKLTLLSALAASTSAIKIIGPSGPYGVTYEVFSLIDSSRSDPYDNTDNRQILASVFTPIRKESCNLETIDYLPPATLDTYREVFASFGLPGVFLEGFELGVCRADGVESDEKFPLVVHSPGFSASRLLFAAQARSLASQGYVVITMDSPGEATVVEFPNGDVIYGLNITDADDEAAPSHFDVRSADVSFLLDQLEHPSDLDLALPSSIDLSKIWAYGHSLGGATAATTILNDDRILGGLNFDGALWGEVLETGVDKPFILAGAPPTGNATSPFGGFYDKIEAPRMHILTEGTVHISFMDLKLLAALKDDLPEEAGEIIDAALGSIDGERLAEIVDELLGAFGEFVVKGETGRLCGIGEMIEELDVVEKDLKGACC